MDELVLEAMARWPNVPAVYGWLRLDRRGNWMLIDRGRPDFDEDLHGQGSPITSPQIVDFIGRNYESDAEGRWYWQNGPQRVYVDLDLAPLVLRVLGTGTQARLLAHTGAPVASVDSAWIASGGELLLGTDLGPGCVHDLDLAALELAQDDGGGSGLLLEILGARLPVGQGPAPQARRFERRPRPASD